METDKLLTAGCNTFPKETQGVKIPCLERIYTLFNGEYGEIKRIYQTS